MKKRLFFKSSVFFVIPLIIPLLIMGVFAFIITGRYVESSVVAVNNTNIAQIKDKLNLILMDMNMLSLNFTEEPAIITVLRSALSDSAVTLDELRSLRMIRASLNSITNSKPYIHSIYIYYNNPFGNFLSTNDGIVSLDTYFDVEWFAHVERKNYEVLTQVREIRRYDFEGDRKKVITLYKPVPLAGAVIVYNIDYQYVYSIISDSIGSEKQQLRVVNSLDEIILDYNPVPELFPQEVLRKTDSSPIVWNGRTYIVSFIDSGLFGWKFYSVMPKDELFKLPRSIRSLAIFLLLLSFGIGFFLTYYFRHRNSLWIKDIVSILDCAEQGLPLPPVPARKDEYGYILHNIIKIFIEQKYLKIQLEEKYSRQKVLELTALQSQLNPHFLYNTLNAIYWEALKISGQPNRVNFMIEKLTDILEYSFNNPGKPVLLENEIEFTNSYLAIQKFRFGDDFKVIWKINPELRELPVPKLLLQPLAENAIDHGLKPKGGRGILKIRIDAESGGVKITVSDNGRGMSEQELAAVRVLLSSDSAAGSHIGLQNTSRRLALYYGDKYRFEIKSSLNVGTVIKIELPPLPGAHAVSV